MSKVENIGPRTYMGRLKKRHFGRYIIKHHLPEIFYISNFFGYFALEPCLMSYVGLLIVQRYSLSELWCASRLTRDETCVLCITVYSKVQLSAHVKILLSKLSSQP